MAPQTAAKNARIAAMKEPGEHVLRCQCGSLVAKIVPGGVELKCRRCKRQIVVPLDLKGGMQITI